MTRVTQAGKEEPFTCLLVERDDVPPEHRGIGVVRGGQCQLQQSGLVSFHASGQQSGQDIAPLGIAFGQQRPPFPGIGDGQSRRCHAWRTAWAHQRVHRHYGLLGMRARATCPSAASGARRGPSTLFTRTSTTISPSLSGPLVWSTMATTPSEG